MAYAYPYDSVCYIVATFADGSSLQGSGAIIGPHTVLTASHVFWDADSNEAAVDVAVYPGYNMGGQEISGQFAFHYFQVNDQGGILSRLAAEHDFAVIDYATDLSDYGYFGISTGYLGGEIHLSGYPVSAHGEQTDRTGRVKADDLYHALNYVTVTASPGNSGGPIWFDDGTPSDPLPYLVGVVSTSGYAVQLTTADLATIDGWKSADSYLWTGTLLRASSALASIAGGSGADTISGWSGAATLFGGEGADAITGGAGFNQVNGNTGEDTIVGHSTVGDWLLGGQGNDSIDASASPGNNIINGNRGDDILVGGSGADTLRGGQGDDVIHVGSGAAWISGDLGVNILYGGPGANTFHAGAGHDEVNGWHAGDRVQLDIGVTYAVDQVNGDVRISFSNGGEMDLIATPSSSLASDWIFNA